MGNETYESPEMNEINNEPRILFTARMRGDAVEPGCAALAENSTRERGGLTTRQNSAFFPNSTNRVHISPSPRGGKILPLPRRQVVDTTFAATRGPVMQRAAPVKQPPVCSVCRVISAHADCHRIFSHTAARVAHGERCGVCAGRENGAGLCSRGDHGVADAPFETQ